MPRRLKPGLVALELTRLYLFAIERGEHMRTLRCGRPYERLNITGIRGLTQAEIAILRTLGTVQGEA